MRESGKRLRILLSSNRKVLSFYRVLSVNSLFISINVFRINFYGNFIVRISRRRHTKNAHINSSITSSCASKKKKRVVGCISNSLVWLLRVYNMLYAKIHSVALNNKQ